MEMMSLSINPNIPWPPINSINNLPARRTTSSPFLSKTNKPRVLFTLHKEEKPKSQPDNANTFPDYEFVSSLQKKVKSVNKALEEAVLFRKPWRIHESMRYSLLAGGKRIHEIEDSTLCTCEIRLSHGLPCFCEMMRSANQNRPTYPTDNDILWKTLHMEGDIEDEAATERAAPRDVWNEVASIFAESANEDDLLMYASMLHQRCHPESSNVREPVTQKPNGRSKNPIESRIPSSWEKEPKEKEGTKQKEKTRRKENPRRSTSSYHSGYPWCDMPHGFEPYVVSFTDVAPDGNCGYKSLSYLIYGSEDSWARVRQEIHEEELVQNSGIYMSTFENRYPALLERVLHCQAHCDRMYLIDFSEVIIVVATKYQKIVNCYGAHGSTSYWPC